MILDVFDVVADQNECVVTEDLMKFLTGLYSTAGQYFNSATANLTAAAANTTKVVPKWDYPGAFTYAVTIVTTIG